MKFFILTSFFLTINLSIFCQKHFSALQVNENLIEVQFKQQFSTFEYTQINGLDYIDFTKTHKITSLEKGTPQLPVFGESFVIPNTGNTQITLLDGVYEEFHNVLVSPSKGNLKRNTDPASVAYFFGEAYQQDQFFPQTPGKLQKPFILRSIRGQVLSLSPFQYNPVTKTLRVYQSMKIVLTTDPQLSGENEIAEKRNKADDLKTYEFLFANKQIHEKYAAVEESGELLIIAPDSYKDSLKDLVLWKTQKGIKTTLKFTSATGSSATQIKAAIQNFYAANPNLKYLILVGDNQQIPAYSYGMSADNEQLSSDSYYGQLSGGDFYPEIFVGRLSGTAPQVATMVKRILEYEKNPMPGDWMTKAIGLGSGQGAGYGDDGEADWQHLRGIHDELLDYGYTHVYEFYDGSRNVDDASGNPITSTITSAVNSGVGFFNYTGHGDMNTCVTGNFSSTQINAATNYGMYPFVISVACNNGTFTLGTCISEIWLRASLNNQIKGAIGACGSSILMAWAPPMETQDGVAELVTEAIPNNKKTTLGGLFYNGQLSMLEQYPGEGNEVMQTWVLFGDPTVDFRDKLTQNLSVSHISSVESGTALNLQFSSATEGATIALSQDSVYLGSGKISSGTCTIDLSALNPSAPITVVGSKQNYKPYVGSIAVNPLGISENTAENLLVYPNPATESIRIVFRQHSDIAKIGLFDLTGKEILNLVDSNPQLDQNELDVHDVSPGVYVLKINDGPRSYTQRVIIN